jgi:hypothetical protein
MRETEFASSLVVDQRARAPLNQRTRAEARAGAEPAMASDPQPD